MHLHLNPVGGLAGDMFNAALLDLDPGLLEPLRQTLGSLEPPAGLGIELTAAPGHLRGRRFHVRLPAGPDSESARHTHYRQIRESLDRAHLDPGVQARAQEIFLALAEAEARVHGVAPEQVVFHEVGNWDSIVDILGAAFLLERLRIDSCSCDALPKGGGRVHTQHGWLPVPAPATACLLEGMPLRDDGIGGERVTPTGAAILRSLKPGSCRPGRLKGTGYGFGSRTLEGVPNCVQAQLLEAGTVPAYRSDRVLELVFELDDQNPEDLALGLEAIRELPGVLNLVVVNTIGKRGRPTQQVQILAEPAVQTELVDASFRETSTLGLRVRETGRWTLARRQRSVDLPEGRVGVKLSLGPDGWRAKAENQDLRMFAGRQQRARMAQRAEQAALRQNEADEQDD